MTQDTQEVKAGWRSRAVRWCINHPLTAWFLTVLLFINYLIDFWQSFAPSF